MAQIQKDINLLPFNTLRVAANAAQFVSVSSPEEIVSVLPELPNETPRLLVLGQGANILFTKDFDGLVLKTEIKGREVLSQDKDSVTVKVSAGENWHELVMWSVENNWSGIENLAFIPGTVGAAPVQNLAAYGQNFGSVVISVNGIDLASRSLRTLSNKECKLYYRDSTFKNELRDKFIITAVTISLSKTSTFDVNYFGRYSYESLRGQLEKMAKPPYSPKQVAEAIIALRRIKLPDWTQIGTAGSFFKNPFVTKKRYEELKKEMPDLQVYPVNNMLYPNPDDPVFKMIDMVKIPAGRLLDELGWRGRRIGNVGTFKKHALVVVSYPGATGEEILDFTRKMQADIKSHYDIDLESEVNIC